MKRRPREYKPAKPKTFEAHDSEGTLVLSLSCFKGELRLAMVSDRLVFVRRTIGDAALVRRFGLFMVRAGDAMRKEQRAARAARRRRGY